MYLTGILIEYYVFTFFFGFISEGTIFSLILFRQQQIVVALRMYTVFEFKSKESYSCLDKIESMNRCNLASI